VAKLINKDKIAQELSIADFASELGNVRTDQWDNSIFRYHNLQIDVLRLDRIHPAISGNKWFKLKYWLEKAKKENKTKLISFGGAYSNHLLALAAAAKINGFSSVGIIRGKEAAKPSNILIALRAFGMSLRFISRGDYNIQKNIIADENDPHALFIPEGGSGIEGVRGAGEILSLMPDNRYTHLFCAVGTGTTMAGLINTAGPEQKIIGTSVLKGTHDLDPVNVSWIHDVARLKNVQMVHQYHFGGYGKISPSLTDFMNRVYSESGIPTDFVYTGKLFYCVERMAEERSFPSHSQLLILHTGGLEGNWSLAPGVLQF
jgi:1-aminocyclopropane-1-carboxylate deaminase